MSHDDDTRMCGVTCNSVSLIPSSQSAKLAYEVWKAVKTTAFDLQLNPAKAMLSLCIKT